MIRRRRPQRRIEFSFDSFLDVVANVVGIILRLILVAWVGARAYKGPPPPPPPTVEVTDIAVPAPPPSLPPLPTTATGPVESTAAPTPPDPLAAELERDRQELAKANADLLAKLKEYNDLRALEPALGTELVEVSTRTNGVEAEKADLDRHAAEAAVTGGGAVLTLEQLRERQRVLKESLEALQREPISKRDLRYRTPVSSPLQTEELMFEVKNGRVSLVDIGALLEQVRRSMRQKGEALRTQWEVSDTTVPAGAFRLRYVLERERDVLDASAGMPAEKGNFRISLAYWEAQAVTEARGEALERALAADSTFRRVVDHLDPQQTAVTFWVYPDSFAEYRRLRDYLHERDIVVAGRPLEDGHPIAGSSKYGKRSRGQ
jgi:hypothetical protein